MLNEKVKVLMIFVNIDKNRTINKEFECDDFVDAFRCVNATKVKGYELDEIHMSRIYTLF